MKPGSNVSANLRIIYVAGLKPVAWEKLHDVLEQCEVSNA